MYGTSCPICQGYTQYKAILQTVEILDLQVYGLRMTIQAFCFAHKASKFLKHAHTHTLEQR